MRSRRATVAEWLAEPEEKGAELIHGRIVYKAFPSPEHGRAQRKLGVVTDAFDHPGETGRAGGWVIDPANRTLVVYRWTVNGYLRVLGAGASAVVRVEPFETLDLRVGLLFGDEGGEAEVAAPRSGMDLVTFTCRMCPESCLPGLGATKISRKERKESQRTQSNRGRGGVLCGPWRSLREIPRRPAAAYQARARTLASSRSP